MQQMAAVQGERERPEFALVSSNIGDGWSSCWRVGAAQFLASGELPHQEAQEDESDSGTSRPCLSLG